MKHIAIINKTANYNSNTQDALIHHWYRLLRGLYTKPMLEKAETFTQQGEKIQYSTVESHYYDQLLSRVVQHGQQLDGLPGLFK